MSASSPAGQGFTEQFGPMPAYLCLGLGAIGVSLFLSMHTPDGRFS